MTQLYTFTDPNGVEISDKSAKWVEEAYGVEDGGAFAMALVKSACVESVKAEAGRRILARWPDFKQTNMNQEATMLVARLVMGTASEADQARLMELEAARQEKQAIIARSHELEAVIGDLSDFDAVRAFDVCEAWDSET